jgi:hypothetical protein
MTSTEQGVDHNISLPRRAPGRNNESGQQPKNNGHAKNLLLISRCEGNRTFAYPVNGCKFYGLCFYLSYFSIANLSEKNATSSDTGVKINFSVVTPEARFPKVFRNM